MWPFPAQLSPGHTGYFPCPRSHNSSLSHFSTCTVELKCHLLQESFPGQRLLSHPHSHSSHDSWKTFQQFTHAGHYLWRYLHPIGCEFSNRDRLLPHCGPSTGSPSWQVLRDVRIGQSCAQRSILLLSGPGTA